MTCSPPPRRAAGTCLLLLAVLLLSLPASAMRADPGDVTTEVTLRATAGKKEHFSADRLRAALEKRLSILSDTPGKVTIDGQGLVHVRVAEPSIAASRVEWFTRPGTLEVVWLRDIQTPKNPHGRYTVTAYGLQGALALRFMDRRDGRFVPTEEVIRHSPRIVEKATLEPGSASPAGEGTAAMKFGPEATRQLARFVRRHGGSIVALLLDGRVVGIPVAVPPRGQATGGKKKEKPPLTPLEQPNTKIVGSTSAASFRQP